MNRLIQRIECGITFPFTPEVITAIMMNFSACQVLFCCLRMHFNALPNDKILDWSKLKAFEDDKINETEKLKFVLESVENMVGKGENAGNQHFLLFPHYFSKGFIDRVIKSRDFVVKS